MNFPAGLLSKFPKMFKQELFGVGATLEKRWQFIGYTTCMEQSPSAWNWSSLVQIFKTNGGLFLPAIKLLLNWGTLLLKDEDVPWSIAVEKCVIISSFWRSEVCVGHESKWKRHEVSANAEICTKKGLVVMFATWRAKSIMGLKTGWTAPDGENDTVLRPGHTGLDNENQNDIVKKCMPSIGWISVGVFCVEPFNQ